MAQPPQPQLDSMHQQIDQVDLQQRIDRLEEQIAAHATANAAALEALEARIEELRVEPSECPNPCANWG